MTINPELPINIPIFILRERIDKEHLPVLYEWAKTSLKWLETNLLSMQKKQGGTLEMAAINLESDLLN